MYGHFIHGSINDTLRSELDENEAIETRKKETDTEREGSWAAAEQPTTHSPPSIYWLPPS